MIICNTHGENRILENTIFHFLKEAKPGKHLSIISHAIQSYVKANGFSIVRGYAGHGVRKDLHGEHHFPQKVPPYNGLILCLEWY